MNENLEKEQLTFEKIYQEKTLPFKYNSWNQERILLNNYYSVEFTEDFGCFKLGEKFSSISVNYELGKIKAYGEDFISVLKTQEYKSIPI